MHSFIIISLVSIMLLVVSPQSAFAYVGPGAGIAAIGTVIALIGGILLAIVAFLWYPIKRLLAKIKQKRMNDQKGTSS